MQDCRGQLTGPGDRRAAASGDSKGQIRATLGNKTRRVREQGTGQQGQTRADSCNSCLPTAWTALSLQKKEGSGGGEGEREKDSRFRHVALEVPVGHAGGDVQ